jgi:hypothetical protein
MIRRGVNPEVVRRQMRHKNVAITLKIYTQVRSEEIEASLPNRPTAREIKGNLNILPFRLRMV